MHQYAGLPTGTRSDLTIGRLIRGMVGTLVAVSFGLTATSLWAQQVEWLGTTSDDWYTAANWDPATVPDDQTHVIIDTITPVPLLQGKGNPPDAQSDHLIVGNQAFGALSIDGGGVLHSSLGVLGQFSGSQANMAVGRDDSQWHVTGSVDVGLTGSAGLTLFLGGQVTSSHVRIGSDSGSSGNVVVQNANSLWTITGNLSVGRFGAGSLLVEDGGKVVVSQQAQVGQIAGSTGALTVRDPGSELEAELLRVGTAADGELLVSNGGKVVTDQGTVGSFNNGEGSALITGSGSEWDNLQLLTVGDEDTARGELTVASGGIARAQQWHIQIASGPETEGTVNIGAPADSPPAPPGQLITPQIRMGTGAATLVFNHDADDFELTTALWGNGLVRSLAGTTGLLANSPDFSGQIEASGGTLVIDAEIALTSLEAGNGGTLGGSGHVDGLVQINDAILAPGGSPGTLTTGNLALTASSTLQFELAGPDDAGDRIDVDGDLVLAGQLEVQALNGFDEGSYRLLNYTGSLTDQGLMIASLPDGFDPVASSIDTSQPGQVNLVVVRDATVFADRFEVSE